MNNAHVCLEFVLWMGARETTEADMGKHQQVWNLQFIDQTPKIAHLYFFFFNVKPPK